MTAKTNAQKQADWYQRQKDRGLKPVTVFVPDGKQRELRQLVKNLYGKHTETE